MSDKGVKNITPIGELYYVQISGEGKDKVEGDDKEFVATVYLEGKAAKSERDKIDEVLGTIPKGLKLGSKGYKNLVRDPEGNLRSPNADGEVFDEEGENIFDDCEDTDVWSFCYHTNVEFPNGNIKKIDVYNKNAKKINLGDKLIGNGSLGSISGKLKPYVSGKKTGVSLFLNAVQITKFEEYEGSAGFGSQEGEFEGVEDADTGFVGTDEDTATGKTKETKVKKKPKL